MKHLEIWKTRTETIPRFFIDTHHQGVRGREILIWFFPSVEICEITTRRRRYESS